MDEASRALITRWEHEHPFNHACRLHVSRWEPSGVTVELPFAQWLSNRSGGYHGGVVAGLIDAAGAGAVMAAGAHGLDDRLATISMTVNYLAAAVGLDLVAEATCVKRGRQVQFAQATVSASDGRIVADGTLSLMLLAGSP
jgi:uncharacterized protein (TIGR00369 family)